MSTIRYNETRQLQFLSAYVSVGTAVFLSKFIRQISFGRERDPQLSQII